MDETALREHILQTCPEATVVDAGGDSYFFTDPKQMHPFATLVTSDAHSGLVAAIGATLPGASWQRCRTHYAVINRPSWPASSGWVGVGLAA